MSVLTGLVGFGMILAVGSSAGAADLSKDLGTTDSVDVAPVDVMPGEAFEAINGSDGTGGGTVGGPILRYDAESRDLLEEKVAEGIELGTMSVDEGRDMLESIGLSSKEALSLAVEADASAVTMAAGGPPTSYTRSMAQVPQETWYYCGPATGYSILKSKGITTSLDGAKKALTQKNLASATYMNTEQYQMTDWYKKDFVRGLNKFGGTSVAFSQYTPKSIDNYKSAIRTGIYGTSGAVAIDTVEFPGMSVYNSHPAIPKTGKARGHWIAAYGYSSDAATVSYVDPAANSPALPSYKYAQAKFTQSTSTFYQFTTTNGIAW